MFHGTALDALPSLTFEMLLAYCMLASSKFVGVYDGLDVLAAQAPCGGRYVCGVRAVPEPELQPHCNALVVPNPPRGARSPFRRLTRRPSEERERDVEDDAVGRRQRGADVATARRRRHPGLEIVIYDEGAVRGADLRARGAPAG